VLLLEHCRIAIKPFALNSAERTFYSESTCAGDDCLGMANYGITQYTCPDWRH
jgi:hypothetical protein